MIEFVSDAGKVYRYDEVDSIGRPGLFGKVYRATAPDGSRVAVKVVGIHSEADRTLAEREVDVWRRLPQTGEGHLVPLLDVAHRQDDLLLVMPEAARNLAELIAEQAPLKSADAASILRQLAVGLQELAAAGVIHRDIKPLNVLEIEGRWMLADYGISKVVNAAPTAGLTFRGNGTVEYRAPELWRNDDERVGSDLYALGCIGYELLTGTKAFPGPDFRLQHMTGAITLPDTVDAPLRTVVLDLLSKEPASRPPDARRVVELLTPRQFTAGQQGLQRMLADTAARRTAKDAMWASSVEYSERQREARLRLKNIWEGVIRSAQAVGDIESGLAHPHDSPYIVVGDYRLLLSLQEPGHRGLPLLLVGRLEVCREGEAGVSPANIVCVLEDDLPQWFLLRFATTRTSTSTMAGIGVPADRLSWEDRNSRIVVEDCALILKEPATDEGILNVFFDAVRV